MINIEIKAFLSFHKQAYRQVCQDPEKVTALIYPDLGLIEAVIYLSVLMGKILGLT